MHITQRANFHNQLFQLQKQGKVDLPCPNNHGQLTPVGRGGATTLLCGGCGHTEPLGDRTADFTKMLGLSEPA